MAERGIRIRASHSLEDYLEEDAEDHNGTALPYVSRQLRIRVYVLEATGGREGVCDHCWGRGYVE